MLESLFKFSRVQFAEGTLGFLPGPAAAYLALTFLLLAGAVYALYTRSRAPARVRNTSLALRMGALLLVFLPLFEPALITPDNTPDENFVAVLLDASASMSLADVGDGEVRMEAARSVLHDAESGILAEIRRDFLVRTYAFGEDATRMDSLPAEASGTETNLTAALDRVLADFSGLPLTGIVLITDGDDNSADVPLVKADEIRDLGIGLHVVGLGSEYHENEREILDIAAAKGVGDNTGAEIDLKVRSSAEETSPVAFTILEEGEPVFSEDRTLSGGGTVDHLTFFFEPAVREAHAYQVTMEIAPGELNAENNTIDIMIDARRDTLRVLYFEGHPRQDFKFIKRALEGDQVIHFTSITRTGTGKLFRQGIRSPEELAGGFPVRPEDLFQFKAIILGDVEASIFSIEQLSLIEEFVRVRGGGFLMTGGRQSFAEGDYGLTPIADVLPVSLDPARRQVLPVRFSDPLDPEPESQGYAFVPTAEGLDSPVLKFSPDAAANRQLWSEMPALTSINFLGAVKPGAQVLARKPDDDYGETEPLLIVQRYGKGRSAALPTSSTWRWQMLLEAEDARHERFWQQLARWLAAESPHRVQLDLDRERLSPGEELGAIAHVYEPTYVALAGAQVRGELRDPEGRIREVRFQEDLTSGGTYEAALVPRSQGIHALSVWAEAEGAMIGRHERYFLVSPSRREFDDATQKRDFLEDLAAGFYYEPAEAIRIPENLRSRRTSTSVFKAQYLWDMPALYFLALLLLVSEWFYRRRKGLP